MVNRQPSCRLRAQQNMFLFFDGFPTAAEALARDYVAKNKRNVLVVAASDHEQRYFDFQAPLTHEGPPSDTIDARSDVPPPPSGANESDESQLDPNAMRLDETVALVDSLPTSSADNEMIL